MKTNNTTDTSGTEEEERERQWCPEETVGQGKLPKTWFEHVWRLMKGQWRERDRWEMIGPDRLAGRGKDQEPRLSLQNQEEYTFLDTWGVKKGCTNDF